ncbi:MAG: hypothetical protein SPK09_01815 [Porphyromonas sp.]|nr:hypothetical protein [Porphyromonas sp.]
MKIKNYTLAALALALLAGTACSKTAEPEQGSTAQSEQQLPKHTVTISLEATFSDGFDEEARAMLSPTEDGILKVEFKDTELMKDGATIDPATGRPVREMNTETGKLTLFFVEKSNLSNVISTTVNPSDFRKTPDGKYAMSFYGDVVLSGLDMNQGEWYISGGYRLDAEGNKTGNISGFTYLDSSGKLHSTSLMGDVTDFKTPFVFGWERLSTKLVDDKLQPSFGQNRNLKLVPDGAFLRVRAINNLVEDIHLVFLAMLREKIGVSGNHTTGFDYTASAASDAELVSTKRPFITKTPEARAQSRYLLGADKTSEILHRMDDPDNIDGRGLVLSPGDYYTIYQRINTPTDVSNTPAGSGIVFHFWTKDRKLGTDVQGNPMDSRETEGLTGTPKYTWPQTGPILTDDWRGGTMFERVYNNRSQFSGRGFRNQVLPLNKSLAREKVHNINFRINSELMITELYTTRFSDRNGSYGLIELYNPTLDEIDLSKYALLRIGYRNDGGTNKIRVVPSTTEYNQNTVNPGLNITDNISSALLLPLDMKNGDASGDWAVNSYSYKLTQIARPTEKEPYRYVRTIEYTQPEASPKTHSGFAANVVDFSTKSYIRGLESITAGATKLKPGKTMIILFSGFAASNYNPTPEDQAIFARIQAAVQAGYCQYVVALGQGNASAQPHEATAGVTTADLGDAFSLVKIANVPSGGYNLNPSNYRNRETRRIFVDGTWAPIDFDRRNNQDMTPIVGSLMANRSVKAILRRPYGPYMWNKGFLPPTDMSSYYQAEYTSADKATFGAPYFTSYEAGKTWNDVVKPRIEKRNASLFKRK